MITAAYTLGKGHRAGRSFSNRPSCKPSVKLKRQLPKVDVPRGECLKALPGGNSFNGVSWDSGKKESKG